MTADGSGGGRAPDETDDAARGAHGDAFESLLRAAAHVSARPPPGDGLRHLGPGARIDRYLVEVLLGQGGMGTVYRARDEKLRRRVALKVLHAGGGEATTRVLREARAAAALDHPNVVAVFDVGEHDGEPYIAMELVAGRPLRAFVGEPTIALGERIRWLVDVARALGAAHRAGLVHRDIKPDNVMRRDDGVIKVLDFGIARRAARAVDPSAPTETAGESMTAGSLGAGTPLYMAPEQIRHQDVDGRTDQFAWGVLAYEVITGRPPWSARDAMALAASIVGDDPAPMPADVPPEVEAVVRRALCKRPGDRFGAMDEIVAVLDPLARPRPRASAAGAGSADGALEAAATARANAERVRPPRKMLLFAAAAALALVGAAALARWDARRPTVAASAAPPASSAAPPVSSAAPGDEMDHATVWRIPIDGSPRRGGREPLVTLVEFADFECPYSARFAETLRRALDKYGDDLAVVWKDLPLDFHRSAEPAARLARLARSTVGNDRGFWQAHDALFTSSTSLDAARLAAVAKDLGLSADAIQRAASGSPVVEVDHDVSLALDFGVGGIPEYFINGRRYSGAVGIEELAPILDEELAKARALVARGVSRARVYDEIMKGAHGPPPPQPRKPYVPEAQATAVRLGAHAIIDVHQLGDSSHGFTALVEPLVQRMLEVYGDRIRFHWHDVVDPTNADAVRAALAGRAALGVGGNDAFWRLHAILLSNAESFYPTARPPRGFGVAALKEYAKEAGISPLYFASSLEPTPEAMAQLERSRTAAALAGIDLRVEHLPVFVVDGYVVDGGTFRGVQRVIERALAEHR